MSSPQSVDTGWETCKENMQPVKAGRKAVALAEVAASPAMALKSHSADIEERLERFWQEVRAAEATEDPLQAWLRFIKWVQETLCTAGNKAELQRVLEACTKSLGGSARYKDDARFLRVWIQYADCVADPTDIFMFLKDNGIGQDFALFYEACATFMELKGAFERADGVYEQGIKRGAKPLERLKQKHAAFQQRMVRRINRKVQEEQLGMSSAQEPSRAALQSLAGAASSHQRGRAINTQQQQQQQQSVAGLQLGHGARQGRQQQQQQQQRGLLSLPVVGGGSGPFGRMAPAGPVTLPPAIGAAVATGAVAAAAGAAAGPLLAIHTDEEFGASGSGPAPSILPPSLGHMGQLPRYGLGRKENEGKAGVWTGVRMPSAGASTAVAPTKLEVYEDDEFAQEEEEEVAQQEQQGKQPLRQLLARQLPAATAPAAPSVSDILGFAAVLQPAAAAESSNHKQRQQQQQQGAPAQQHKPAAPHPPGAAPQAVTQLPVTATTARGGHGFDAALLVGADGEEQSFEEARALKWLAGARERQQHKEAEQEAQAAAARQAAAKEAAEQAAAAHEAAAQEAAAREAAAQAAAQAAAEQEAHAAAAKEAAERKAAAEEAARQAAAQEAARQEAAALAAAQEAAAQEAAAREAAAQAAAAREAAAREAAAQEAAAQAAARTAAAAADDKAQAAAQQAAAQAAAAEQAALHIAAAQQEASMAAAADGGAKGSPPLAPPAAAVHAEASTPQATAAAGPAPAHGPAAQLASNASVLTPGVRSTAAARSPTGAPTTSNPVAGALTASSSLAGDPAAVSPLVGAAIALSPSAGMPTALSPLSNAAAALSPGTELAFGSPLETDLGKGHPGDSSTAEGSSAAVAVGQGEQQRQARQQRQEQQQWQEQQRQWQEQQQMDCSRSSDANAAQSMQGMLQPRLEPTMTIHTRDAFAVINDMFAEDLPALQLASSRPMQQARVQQQQQLQHQEEATHDQSALAEPMPLSMAAAAPAPAASEPTVTINTRDAYAAINDMFGDDLPRHPVQRSQSQRHGNAGRSGSTAQPTGAAQAAGNAADPTVTINTRAAFAAINGMFEEDLPTLPLRRAPVPQRQQQQQQGTRDGLARAQAITAQQSGAVLGAADPTVTINTRAAYAAINSMFEEDLPALPLHRSSQQQQQQQQQAPSGTSRAAQHTYPAASARSAAADPTITIHTRNAYNAINNMFADETGAMAAAAGTGAAGRTAAGRLPAAPPEPTVTINTRAAFELMNDMFADSPAGAAAQPTSGRGHASKARPSAAFINAHEGRPRQQQQQQQQQRHAQPHSPGLLGVYEDTQFMNGNDSLNANDGLGMYEDTQFMTGNVMRGSGGGAAANAMGVYEDTQFMTGMVGGQNDDNGGDAAASRLGVYEDTQFMTGRIGQAAAAHAGHDAGPEDVGASGFGVYEDTEYISRPAGKSAGLQQQSQGRRQQQQQAEQRQGNAGNNLGLYEDTEFITHPVVKPAGLQRQPQERQQQRQQQAEQQQGSSGNDLGLYEDTEFITRPVGKPAGLQRQAEQRQQQQQQGSSGNNLGLYEDTEFITDPVDKPAGQQRQGGSSSNLGLYEDTDFLQQQPRHGRQPRQQQQQQQVGRRAATPRASRLGRQPAAAVDENGMYQDTEFIGGSYMAAASHAAAAHGAAAAAGSAGGAHGRIGGESTAQLRMGSKENAAPTAAFGNGAASPEGSPARRGLKRNASLPPGTPLASHAEEFVLMASPAMRPAAATVGWAAQQALSPLGARSPDTEGPKENYNMHGTAATPCQGHSRERLRAAAGGGALQPITAARAQELGVELEQESDDDGGSPVPRVQQHRALRSLFQERE